MHYFRPRTARCERSRANPGNGPMRHSIVLLAALALLTSSARALAEDALGDSGVRGAGSTFAYPLLSRWSNEYRDWSAKGGAYAVPSGGLDDALPSSRLEYEAVGSLAGVQRVRQRAVDFGASDMPLSAAELSADGLAQFPFVIGGVVVVTNIAGQTASELRLSGPVLARIFLGSVRSWSDPAIKALNPSVQLPDAPIQVVHRADGSGTTYNFTSYLAHVSPEWRAKPGAGLLINWPTGLAAKGNEGVAKTVLGTQNSIGYVDLAQARQLKLAPAALQNRAGQFVKPNAASFQAAAADANWDAASSFDTTLLDQPGALAYPITATVFALVPTKPRNGRADATLDFFRWSLDHGDNTASQLGYVPLPSSLVEQVKEHWRAALR
jgi:phosphate transport system substrate-binding protein